jgi:salicylate hydroxylase
MRQMDPTGEVMYGWLYGHDAVGAAEKPLPTHHADGRVMQRPEAQLAFETWRDALAHEDRSRLWVGEREGYAQFLARSFPAPEGVTVQELDCDGVPALKVVPAGGAADDGVAVVHLHGGGYTMGSARGAIELAARLAAAVGGWALVPDYRLAPEHAFPAALDDVTVAYRWLVRQPGIRRLMVSGECAGGGLAVALAVRLRDAGQRLPDLVHAVSPFADLTLSSDSANASPVTDPWFNRGRLRLLAASYLHTAAPDHPLISPARADLRGLPRLLIHAAAGESLADDATLLARTAATAGVEVTLNLIEDSVHSFVLFACLPETTAALEQLAVLAGSAASPVSS